MSIQDLVTYYQQQADGLCVSLIHACSFQCGEKSRPAVPSRYAFKLDEWEIDRKQIRLVGKCTLTTNVIFADVWEGVWNGNVPVTVTTRQQQAVSDIVHTVKLMGIISHGNIIQLLGVCTKETPIYIITEFMKHGSLLEYLRGERSLKLSQLINMAAQMAAGMAYLEEQNVTHRNLAARSILVGENLICKVANFEMACQGDFFEAV